SPALSSSSAATSRSRRLTSTAGSISSDTPSRSASRDSIEIRDGSRRQDGMSLSTSTEQETTLNEAPFPTLPATAAAHFKLHFLGAVLQTLAHLAQNLGSLDDALEQFPFLGDYLGELAELGVADLTAEGALEAWFASVREWEHDVSVHLPLRALRDAAGLDDDA